MSMPAKPVKPARSTVGTRPAAAPPAPTPELTPGERAVLEAYRQMDDRSRGNAVRVLRAWASNFPRRAAPALRLVAGGTA